LGVGFALGFIAIQQRSSLKEKNMSKKHKGGPAPIPAGNKPKTGTDHPFAPEPEANPHGAPASEQDPKRRLGNYATAGEHAIEQPGGKQGANQ
jgi:hypothetical protein